GGPELVRQHRDALGVGAVVAVIQQPPEHRVQAMTSKNEPLTTPAVTMRGPMPGPISRRSTVEKSPNARIVRERDSRSRISGIENVRLSVPMPNAVWRM